MKNEKYDECDVPREEVRARQYTTLLKSLFDNVSDFIGYVWDAVSSERIQFGSTTDEDFMNIFVNGLEEHTNILKEEEQCRHNRRQKTFFEILTSRPTYIASAPRRFESGSLFDVGNPSSSRSYSLFEIGKQIGSFWYPQEVKEEAKPTYPKYEKGSFEYAMDYNRACNERHKKGLSGLTSWEYDAIIAQGLDPAEPGGLANVENSVLCPHGGSGPKAAAGGVNANSTHNGGNSVDNDKGDSSGPSQSSDIITINVTCTSNGDGTMTCRY